MSQKEELSPRSEAVTAAPARTSKAFRDGLLGRLPLLREPGWQAKEAFDVQEDLAELGELGADSLLDPIAGTVGARNE